MTIPAIDWNQLFSFTVSPIELFLRGTLTYLFLFVLFRFFARRDVGSMTISDLLVIVIIADASQNAMSSDYKSVTDGAIVVLTIVGWNWLFNYLGFHFRWIRRILVPRPVLVVKDGERQTENLRREKITEDELQEMLREHEIDDLADVKRAYLEADGHITVLKRRKSDGAAPPQKHFTV